ncbi:MAG TPA: hypothetical protein VFP63_03285 [Dehalococcoidia bacterium]|nr:hypothetical protein [Dehalococcoidia bacterium]
MSGKLLLFAAAPLMMLYTALAGPVSLPLGNLAAQETARVEGATVTCPDGRSLTTVFELDGARFHVLGALVSMEGRSFVVAGPTGDVPVLLGDAAPVSTGLVIGQPAEASGSVGEFGDYVADSLVAVCAEAAPAPTDAPAPIAGNDDDVASVSEDAEHCNRGPGHAGDLRLEVRGKGVDIKRATVLSSDGGVVTLKTLGGQITVLITDETKVIGDLSLASEVRIKGDLDENEAVVADRAWALCPDGNHHQGDDAGDDNEDIDKDEDDGDEDEEGSDDD